MLAYLVSECGNHYQVNNSDTTQLQNMHLAIVSPFPPAITGIGQYGYHITRALDSSGSFSRITVLAGANHNGQSPNHLAKTEVKYRWRPNSMNARGAILSNLQRLAPDLVWFNLGASIFGRSPLSNLSGLLTPMVVSRNLPTVVTMHELVALSDLRTLKAPGGVFAAWGARLVTEVASQADVICLTMRHYADWLAERGVESVHIPIGAYHEPELLDETGNQELLFFTTLAPFKGLELLIEAFKRLRGKYPGLKLTIAGAAHTRFPGYADRLKSGSDNLEGLRWLGEIPEEDVKDLFRRAQVVVLPYRASTGSSSVLYQAATWGRAIVASNLPEFQALAQENDLRLEYFENGDSSSLIDAISRLLESIERRRAQVLHNFNSVGQIRPAKTCHLYLATFNRALEKRDSHNRISIPGMT